MENSRVYFKEDWPFEVIMKVEENTPIYFENNNMILSELYWGKSALTGLTGDQVLSTLSADTGYAGGFYPAPRSYNVPIGNTFVYFAIPDSPSGSTYGYRAINLLRTSNGSVISTAHNSLFCHRQTSPLTTDVPPTASRQEIYYGLIDIYGTVYRLYRSNGFWGSTIYTLNVYSIDE